MTFYRLILRSLGLARVHEAHRLQSTAVAFHAPIKMKKIHLPGNRHKNRNKNKHVDSTKDGIHLLGQLYMTMHVREGNSDRMFEVENAVVHRPYPNMASQEVAKSRTCYPAWK